MAAAGANPGSNAGAVCLLRYPTGSGSGFHYGGGWIVTNSHVVGRNAENLPNMGIEFTAVIVPNTNPPQHLVLPARQRVCFFKRIRYDPHRADFERIDLAFFLVEESEHPGVTIPTTAVFGVRNVPLPGSLPFPTYCLHHRFGSPLQRSPPPPSAFELSTVVVGIAENAVFLQRGGVTTGPGSSGSPIFYGETDQVIALHFSDPNMSACPGGYDAPHASLSISMDLVRDILGGDPAGQNPGGLVAAIAALQAARREVQCLLRSQGPLCTLQTTPRLLGMLVASLCDAGTIVGRLGLEVVVPPEWMM